MREQARSSLSQPVLRVAYALVRTMFLLVLVLAGTHTLMHVAPGYFTDAAELDGTHSAAAQDAQLQRRQQEGSLPASLARTLAAYAGGDAGVSRQYGVPALALVRPRLGRSALLLLRGLTAGWLLAVCGALFRLCTTRAGWLATGFFALLLAVPAGAWCTVCLSATTGGPATVLALIVAARDYPFLHRLLRQEWTAPALLCARCAGVDSTKLLTSHLLPAVWPHLGALMRLSLLTALGALLPVEVLFDVPGVAQLAWNAVGNRDQPVLLAVTLVFAVLVLLAGSQGESLAAEAAI